MAGGPYCMHVVIGGSILLGIAALIYVLCRRAREPHWLPVGTLRAINVYPLKSGAGTLVPHARCQDLGVRYKCLTDRMFVVYDEEGKVVTARTSPNLLRIKVLPTSPDSKVRFTTSSGRDFFDLDFTDISIVTSPISMKFPTTDTEMLHTRDCGSRAAAWISAELEKPGVRLGFWPAGFGRDILKARSREIGVFKICNNITGAYSNLSSFLLLNCSSVDDLVGRLGAGSTVGTDNFRGNILVSGAQPYAEDRWEKLRIGTASFRIVKPCVRCMLVTIDPKTLVKDPNMEPLRTLKTPHFASGRIFYRESTEKLLRRYEKYPNLNGDYVQK
ncbi:mitochondrial amidoxime-reducing component 1 isoform X2 [Halyomorpha halys]|uniref:mitochondrial amidoxime-reducing component 1 isoform X2 n=1 Tax=Halyomorpha halys TaxID=286706 RepID=UPI0034D31FBD